MSEAAILPAPTAPYTTLAVSVDEAVACITLCRPDKMNAFDDAMKADLLAALKAVERDPAVRAVVLTGAGRAFCSGQDLQMDPDKANDLPVGRMLREKYHPIFEKLRSMPKPVIAAVQGVAAGMGVSLALACDMRVMASETYMTVAFIRIGLIPDCGATWTLTRLIGPGRAFELAATGDRLSAEKALAWGAVNEVVPSGQVLEAAMQRARVLAAGPTRALGLLKKALDNAIEADFPTQLLFESHMQQTAARTADFAEGVRAFGEKRPPQFTGA
ncbi:MAG: enoyl-CoA hydratase-related protein [Candidatus Sericytochromatia bacterium]|nr:enoyl-CoA hydratase-related protein [Candidatus Sericytochromatia bacterium]